MNITKEDQNHQEKNHEYWSLKEYHLRHQELMVKQAGAKQPCMLIVRRHDIIFSCVSLQEKCI